MIRRLLALVLVGLALAACSGAASPSPVPTVSIGPVATPSAASGAPSEPPSPSPSASLAAPASPIVGVVTNVEATGLDKVQAFTIRLADGESWRIRIGTLENGAQFPPGHLKEHQATSDPVRVFFRTDGSDLVAYRIEDAG